MVILTNTDSKFDELMFFAQVKKRPGLHLGQPSLVSFRDQLFGMSYAFSFYCQESPLKYFSLFVDWYNKEILQEIDGYACWWNHILYISGNNDAYAFECFFRVFERYLHDVHDICLPDAT